MFRSLLGALATLVTLGGILTPVQAVAVPVAGAVAVSSLSACGSSGTNNRQRGGDDEDEGDDEDD